MKDHSEDPIPIAKPDLAFDQPSRKVYYPQAPIPAACRNPLVNRIAIER